MVEIKAEIGRTNLKFVNKMFLVWQKSLETKLIFVFFFNEYITLNLTNIYSALRIQHFEIINIIISALNFNRLSRQLRFPIFFSTLFFAKL